MDLTSRWCAWCTTAIPAIFFMLFLVPSSGYPEMPSLDPALRPYQKIKGISGTLTSIGSDTLNNLLTLWAEGFRRQYPGVKIQVEGKGSGTAPPALIEGTAQLGPMSRTMKPSEMDKFEEKFGYGPTAYSVAIDAIAIYVHKDNPLVSLSLDQLDAIFSKGRRAGYKRDIRQWGQLGLTGEWAAAPISLYGRNSASGTYGFLKDHALKNGDFKDEVKEQPGSASVVHGITEDRYGIGYSGIGYSTAGVRIVPLTEQEGKTPIAPSQASTRNGTYPIWRPLYIYINQPPGKPLPPLVAEFLRYVYSRDGQAQVLKDGYFPLDAGQVEKELKRIK